jgi:hypothetical protein
VVVWWLHGNRTLLKNFLYGMKYNMAAMRNIFLTFVKKITNETLELVTWCYLVLTYVGLEDTYTVYYVRILIYRVNNRIEMSGNTNVYRKVYNFNH